MEHLFEKIFLLELLSKFQEKGIVQTLRMCLTCRYFEMNAFPDSEKPHLCQLTERAFADNKLKVRCERNKQGF